MEPLSFIAILREYWNITRRIIASLFIVLISVLMRKFAINVWGRVVQGIEFTAKEKSIGVRIEEHYAKPARHFINLVFIGLTFIMLLGVWGLTGIFEGLFIGAGVATVIIGFAAQGILSDFLAGVMIFFDHPFKIGDWIKVKDVEGIVTDVTMRSTRIKSFDGEYVTIPNRKMAEEIILNKSRGDLRLRVLFGVDYNADVGKAVELALQAVKSKEGVLVNPQPSVNITELGGSSVNLELLFWISDPGMDKVLDLRTEVMSEVKKLFEENGIQIPFQHVEVIQHPR